MSTVEKLNNVDHANVRILTDYSADLGDNVMFVPVYPNELRRLQGTYPLLFYKDADQGGLHPVALLGFEARENLFLSPQGWDATQIPMMSQRGPLLIGFEEDRTRGRQPVAAIDMSHPKVSHEQGEPLFLEEGGQSDYLDFMAGLLDAIQIGHAAREQFIHTLETHDLITPCEMAITLANSAQHTLSGYYMIDDEKLQALSGEALTDLQDNGFLTPAFMMLSSLSQLAHLIARKNASLG